MEYDFTLRFALPEEDSEPGLLVERLAGAGCDDATVGIGRPGRVVLDFTREAASANDAMLGAIADVKRAAPGAVLVEAGPDFVGISDVANIVGVSRQAIRKVILAHPTSFPPPLHEGSASLWRLAHVLDWMRGRNAYPVGEAIRDVAHAAMQLNLAREAPSLRAGVRRALRQVTR